MTSTIQFSVTAKKDGRVITEVLRTRDLRRRWIQNLKQNNYTIIKESTVKVAA